jgi:hypothetical protein
VLEEGKNLSFSKRFVSDEDGRDFRPRKLNNFSNDLNSSAYLVENNAFSTFSAEELDMEFYERKKIENERQQVALNELCSKQKYSYRGKHGTAEGFIRKNIESHSANTRGSTTANLLGEFGDSKGRYNEPDEDDNYQFTPVSDFNYRQNYNLPSDDFLRPVGHFGVKLPDRPSVGSSSGHPKKFARKNKSGSMERVHDYFENASNEDLRFQNSFSSKGKIRPQDPENRQSPEENSGSPFFYNLSPRDHAKAPAHSGTYGGNGSSYSYIAERDDYENSMGNLAQKAQGDSSF